VTVILNTIWGGRVSQIVDRQITRRVSSGDFFELVDPASMKICVVLCSNALVSIAYTGVAVANSEWMDATVASCLAHRRLATAMIQPGAPLLARPLHILIRELAWNLNERLNCDKRARADNLQLSIVGWHLGRRLTPLAWELRRGRLEPNGMRYFRLIRNPVGKFLRECPTGLWAQSLGDTGTSVDAKLKALGKTRGFTHDDVEHYAKDVIGDRARETSTVGPECIGVQLDPLDTEGEVQFTYYPRSSSETVPALLSAWVLTPTIVCAPAAQSTFGTTFSACGAYRVGGFRDCRANLHVRTRLPASIVHYAGSVRIAYATQERAPVS
jgi:hypothetical protein